MGALGSLDAAAFAVGFAAGMLIVYAIAPPPRCFRETMRSGPATMGHGSDMCCDHPRHDLIKNTRV